MTPMKNPGTALHSTGAATLDRPSQSTTISTSAEQTCSRSARTRAVGATAAPAELRGRVVNGSRLVLRSYRVLYRRRLVYRSSLVAFCRLRLSRGQRPRCTLTGELVVLQFHDGITLTIRAANADAGSRASTRLLERRCGASLHIERFGGCGRGSENQSQGERDEHFHEGNPFKE